MSVRRGLLPIIPSPNRVSHRPLLSLVPESLDAGTNCQTATGNMVTVASATGDD